MGEWCNDQRHGFGIEQFPNGDTYYGDFNEGKRSGLGKYHYQGHNYCFLGCFKEGMRMGLGRLEGPEICFIGGWINDMRQGIGF